MLNTFNWQPYFFLLFTAIILFTTCADYGLDSERQSDSTSFESDESEELGLLPLDSRWEHPQFLTYRPADGLVVDVNAPRFSWPYVPHVVLNRHVERQMDNYHELVQNGFAGELLATQELEGSREGTVPLQVFTLQICSTGEFTDPKIEVVTDYNYYNALPVLDPGTWHWRVKYSWKEQELSDAHQWSSVRTFIVNEDTPEWDRTVITEAADLLAGRGRPRLGPADGDWQRWRQELDGDERAGEWFENLLDRVERVTHEPWWDDFPESDREGENPYSPAIWGQDIGPNLVDAILAYRLTGDDRFERAADYFLRIAGYPVGGYTSPEYFYEGPKWGTRVTLHLAIFYDWWHDQLSDAEREKVLDAIDWRLKGILLEKYSWRGEHGVWPQGVSVFAGSHPFENFYLASQAALLVAGDLEFANTVLEHGLHYLTGVTTPYGPDEGWNEGMAYGVYKTSHPLDFKFMVAMTLPELEINKNPMLQSLGRWHAHLLPLGIGRLPFGDSSALEPSRFRQHHSNVSLQLAWLTGEPLFMHRRQALEELGYDGASPLIWPEQFDLPKPAESELTAVHFPEAGWAMAASHGPSDLEGFHNGTGMIFQSRPRGGFGHSYRAENTFAWHALGHTISSPGGSVRFRDPHAHHTMSHNGILINGQGQEWDASPRESRYPFAGRLLAWQENDDYVHWVGDATYAYQTVEGLQRAHRHVLLIDDEWFVVYDDLAMRDDAEPARFSYLFHVVPDVEGELDAATARFRLHMPGGNEEQATQSSGALQNFPALAEKDPVDAEVALANNPQELELLNLQHRETFLNPITGEDIYEEALETQQRWNRVPLAMAHNIWATNREPAHQWQFLSTYIAWRSDEPRIETSFPSPHQVIATYPDGRQRHVSFDPEKSGDINIDLAGYRGHAAATEPNYLPEAGERETLNVDEDDYEIEWLHVEPFDTAWVMRWIHEGDALVKVKNSQLHQRKVAQDHAVQSTVWLRPELPQNLALRIRVRVDEPIRGNAGNVNLILHARESDGRRLDFGRTGIYPEYHEIPNYIITLVGGDREGGHNRLRRNPGFNLLVDNQDVRSYGGETYELLVTLVDGRIRYYLDREKKIDYTVEDPLPAGRLGLRTWNSNVVWEQIEIGQVN